MSPFLEGMSKWEAKGDDNLYDGYVASVKNTFIDIAVKPQRLKRSISCSATFRLSKFDSTVATSAIVEPALEDPPVSPTSRSSTISNDSEAVSTVLQGILSASASSAGSTSSLDDDISAQVHEDFVNTQYRKYLANVDNSGQTLMWHGLPTKYQVEPHLASILEKIGATNVGYLYLPLNHWEKKDNPQGKCRNKGYAFIHFVTDAAALDFTNKVSDFCTEQRRLTATTKAVHQGISANLRALVAAPHKRTTSGSLYLPNKVGKLERVSIHAFRDLSSRMPKRASS
jgi:hypothetical protein